MRLLSLMLLCLATACTEVTTTSSGLFGEDTTVQRRPWFGGVEQSTLDATGRRNFLRRGTDSFLSVQDFGPSRPSQALITPSGSGTVEVSLVNASVESAAQAILAEALGMPFTIADGVSARITIQSTGPIEAAALLELFEAALSANGARLERTGETVAIVPGTTGNRSFRVAGTQGPAGASIIVAPLQFISASQMAELLDPLVDEGLTVVAERERNLLLLSGTAPQIEAALDALNLFDVDVLQGKSVALVPVDVAEPEDLVEELQTIFESREGGMLDGVVEFIPNNRLGSVLVITSRSRYLAEAQRWIRDLDRTANRNRRTTRVITLQNRNAGEIAPILNKILADVAEAQLSGDGAAGASPAKVAADPSRNALVVRATKIEHDEIVQMLRDLDSAPRQVLLEATIAEVTLNDQLELGVRWFFSSGNFGNTFTDVVSGAVASTFPGFSSVFTTGSSEFVLNALASVTDVKVISSPTLMVMDNKEATLQIGDEVPVATTTSVSTADPDAPIVSAIEYRDTGIILDVKPQIGRDGRVILDISQEVSSVASTSTSGIDSPTIRQRQISTSVALRDGLTLALGGLVRESDNVTETKVPGLGDVPVLGAAFRSRSLTKDRSELLILIRPRIVETDDEAQRITAYWRSKISQADTILQTGLGAPRHRLRNVLE